MNPQFMKRLSQPSRVASILDWKKNHTLLAVNFHKDRVGIAIASHPSLGAPCTELEPLRFDRDSKSIAGAINKDCLERFSTIVEEHKVCGVVVNWPLQRETGRMGAACGRVVFALEKLWARSNESTSSSSSSSSTTTTVPVAAALANAPAGGFRRKSGGTTTSRDHRGVGLLSRPFCLWDAGHIDLKDPAKRVDSFGRCASYGKEKQPLHSAGALSTTTTTNPPLVEKTHPLLHSGYKNNNNNNNSNKTKTNRINDATDRFLRDENKYFASKEQYYEDEQTVVLGVWDDFCREHWPDLSTPTVEAAICGNAKAKAQTTNAQPSSMYHDLGKDPPERIQRETTSTTSMAKKTKKKSLVTMR